MTANRNNDLYEYFMCAARSIVATLLSLLIFASLCVMFGCSSLKKSEKSSIEVVEKNTDSIVNGISFDKKWFEKYIEANLSSNENTRIVIYDTRLPIDSFTNERPVLAVINKEKNTSINGTESDISVEHNTDITSIIQSSDSSSFKMEKEVEQTETKNSVSSWRIYAFISLVVFVIFMTLWGKHLIQDAAFWLLNKIFK